MKKWSVQIVAILVIGGIVAYGQYQGIDGVMASLGVGAVAGIAGFKIAQIKKKE